MGGREYQVRETNPFPVKHEEKNPSRSLLSVDHGPAASGPPQCIRNANFPLPPHRPTVSETRGRGQQSVSL